MNKMFKKILCTMLAMLMILTIAPISGFVGVEASAAETTSGTCGDDAYWQFEEETGELVISGTGAIYDAATIDEETGDFAYDEETGDIIITSPWYSFKDEITTLVIEEGITQIGMLAFYNCFYLTDVSLPSTLETVCVGAFCNCIRLEKLNFPEGVKNIYYSNYDNMAVKNIVFPASLENLGGFELNEGYYVNMCVYLESVTIPAEVGAVSATIDLSNPSIRNIYNNSMEALIKFDVSEYWWGDEATAEYMTITMGAVLETIEYEMTDEELQAFVSEKVTAYYDEYYDGIIPEPVYSETVPDYITVYCYENSAQHTYCVENDINYVLLDDGHIHTDSDGDSVCNICGYENMCGEKVYYEFEEETGTLTIKGEGEMYNYDYDSSPFSYRDDILHVVIEDGVTAIGREAFSSCRLISVNISDSVTEIGPYAFQYCSLLTSVVIPENVASIGPGTFKECYSIESFVVDVNNLYYSSDDYGVLFNKDKTELIQYPVSSDITEYYVPNSIIRLNTSAFYFCSNLNIIYIPDSVNEIIGAFYGCDSVSRIEVDENNLYYSSDENGILFNKDKSELIKYPESSRVTSYNIPETVKTIGTEAIHLCNYLEKIYIGESVNEIEGAALSRNRRLRKIEVSENNPNYSSDENGVLFNKDKSVLYQYTTGNKRKMYAIPDTVVMVGASAFEDSTYLRTIVIPKTVKTVEYWNFVTSSNLTDVYYIGTDEQWNEINIGAYNEYLEDATIHFNYDGTSPIIVESGYCCENVTYELYSDGTLIISGDGAMYDYEWLDDEGNGMPPYMTWDYDENGYVVGESTIKKVIIEEGVTTIGNYAFNACRALESVEIADTVTSIGETAFDYCTSLKEVVIPDSVTSIGFEAFSESALESITLSENLETIGDIAFFCCENLKEIVIPESVTSIGESAFGMCSSLESITILNKNCELADMFIFDAVIDDETGDATPVELKAVVKGYTDSTAQIYAEKMTEAGYATKFEAIDAHVHTPVTYTQEASCTVNGYTLTTCAECLEQLSYEIIEATGHIEGEVVIENKLEPTCTKSGSYDKVVYCSACGEELSRVTEVEYALGHSYSAGIVVTPATLVSEGYGYKECERCDERIDYVIPMLEGTVSKDTSKDISVEYLDEAYDGNMQIKVEEDFTGSQYLTQSYTKFESWNIKTYVNGVEVQPDAPVLVTLPLPAGYNQATVAVYHINSATGKLEKMSPLYFEDGYVKFLASSFSVYMVVDESSVEELDPSDDCSCNCHKSGFMGFIWKILRFFYKLFGINKVCGCGAAHY